MIDPLNHILKLCDFGSSKVMSSHEFNASYMTSRYYRAPELLFGSENYGCSLDIWSIGCVISEMLLG